MSSYPKDLEAGLESELLQFAHLMKSIPRVSYETVPSSGGTKAAKSPELEMYQMIHRHGMVETFANAEIFITALYLHVCHKLYWGAIILKYETNKERDRFSVALYATEERSPKDEKSYAGQNRGEKKEKKKNLGEKKLKKKKSRQKKKKKSRRKIKKKYLSKKKNNRGGKKKNKITKRIGW